MEAAVLWLLHVAAGSGAGVGPPAVGSPGRLVLTVAFAARWDFVAWDYERFTPSGLDRLLQGAGFRSVEVYARGNELTVACYKVMALILPLLFGAKAGVVGTLLRRTAGPA